MQDSENKTRIHNQNNRISFSELFCLKHHLVMANSRWVSRETGWPPLLGKESKIKRA